MRRALGRMRQVAAVVTTSNSDDALLTDNGNGQPVGAGSKFHRGRREWEALSQQHHEQQQQQQQLSDDDSDDTIDEILGGGPGLFNADVPHLTDLVDRTPKHYRPTDDGSLMEQQQQQVEEETREARETTNIEPPTHALEGAVGSCNDNDGPDAAPDNGDRPGSRSGTATFSWKALGLAAAAVAVAFAVVSFVNRTRRQEPSGRTAAAA